MKKNGTKKLVGLYIDEKKRVLDSFPVEQVTAAAKLVVNTYLNGGTVYTCGNGGGVSYAKALDIYLSNHPFVSDDKGRPFPDSVKRLRTFDLTSSVADITGIANDFGFDYIFGNQLEAQRVKEGDLVVGFTGSGNTKNVLNAFEVAKRHNANTLVMTNGDGGKSKNLADLCIAIPGDSSFPGQVGKNNNCFHFEDSAMAAIHMITGLLKKRIQRIYDINGKARGDDVSDSELAGLYVKEAKECLGNFPINDVAEMAGMIGDTYFNGGSLYLCGNGSNATLLGNLNCDLGIHPFVGEAKSKPKFDGAKRFRVRNLADSGPTISGYANDYGADNIFSQQLKNLRTGRDDLVVGFTGSGSSPNILKAFGTARENQSRTIGITRGKNSDVKGLSDLCVEIPVDSKFPGQIGGNKGNFHFEDSLLTISHIVTGALLSKVEDIYSEEQNGG